MDTIYLLGGGLAYQNWIENNMLLNRKTILKSSLEEKDIKQYIDEVIEEVKQKN
jgi:hypothetical protein